MSGIRRRLTAGLAAASALAAAPMAVQAQHASRQVISRAELEAGGWTRLSELVFAIRGAARASVDGITVHGNVTGTPAWQAAPGPDDWLIVVDGQPMPVRFAGTSVLDLLPVSLAQLDSVVVQRTPALVAGRFASHGVLRLHTRSAEPGVHGSASHYSGNEVGDAGPFTFTPDVTPNIDNSGPFHQGRIAYGAPVGQVDIAIRRWTDNLTDRRIAARHEDAAAPAAPELWVRHIAPTLHAGVTVLGGRHDVHAGTAQLRGTFFVPSLRAEQSLATRLTYGGIGGQLAAAPTVIVAYRLGAAELEAAPYGAPLPATLAHQRRELAGSLALRHAGDRVAAEAGVAVARQSLASTVVDVAGFASATVHAPWQPRVDVLAGRGLAGARGAVALAVAPRLDSATSVQLTLSADSRAHGDDGAWVDLELFGLGSLAADRRVTAVADLEWRRVLARGVTLSLGGAARRETGLRLLSTDSTGAGPHEPPVVSPALTLTNGELRTAIDLPVSGPVTGGVVYRLSRPLGGWDPAREAGASLPRHLLDASVVLVPVLDIRVRPALHLASRTRWRPDDTASFEEVPSVVRLDLSLEKWFLHRRLRAQLLARNLLNDVERYHPLGADFRLRIFAGATLSF